MTRFQAMIYASCAFLTGTAMAGDLFLIDATMNGQTAHAGFNTAEDAANLYTTGELDNILPGYNGTQAVVSRLNFRGMPVNLSYPTAGSTLMVFDVPSINEHKTFQGATRDESQAQFKDYLEKNPDLLARMQKELVKVSPVDPVAGNPNSLMSRTATLDYAQGFAVGPTGASGGDGVNKFGVAITYSHMVTDAVNGLSSQDSDTISLPLSYSHRFDEPNHELIVNLPLSYTTNNGAKSYDAGAGILYRWPARENWVLSVGGNLRATGSVDLLSGAALASGTLMSSYVFGDVDAPWTLTMGNMISYYRSVSGKINGSSYNPELSNIIYKNGLLYAHKLGGDERTVEVYIVDTRFSGTDLFSSYQDEIGITYGTRRPSHASATDYRGGISLLTGENLKTSFQLNFGGWF
ncbi:hypothetical protein IGB42_02571 [Andreprevotia sp. IGB-42]|uniref:hypothetical protein n=1 Tax=Andreprevotia sp. IGB-42 TaxID=2497473 RepID=UPI00135B0073|nr:hypothetical protein [Andreprevotia sp. IGB-42]KAF0812731.1 hypothetical protein IGB42_02571 [Andreprevotia sp. IGB-42]